MPSAASVSGQNNNPTPQTDVMAMLSQLIPGFQPRVNTALGNIDQLLSGNPSPSLARNANAYFGAGSGLAPGSEFLRNRGFDLYNTQSNAMRQQGTGDLMQFMQGLGSIYTPLYSATSNADLARAKLAQDQSQFGAQNQLGWANLAANLAQGARQSGMSKMPEWTRQYLL